MPRSWVREGMGQGGGHSRRAQTEPFAALAAVFVVGLALAVYAGAFEAVLPAGGERTVAEPTADRVERALSSGGVLATNLSSARASLPAGYHATVTLEYANTSTTVGPTPPPTAVTASRRVSVRIEPGDIRPGRLEVTVWS